MQGTIRQITHVTRLYICQTRLYNLDLLWQIFINTSGYAINYYSKNADNTTVYISSGRVLAWRY
jgi:hypothetical protein